MKEVLLLKCGEIVLKGLNRKTFEDRLLKNLKRRMAHVADCEISMRQSVVYVEIPDDADADAVMECASRVFGFATISRAAVCPEKTLESVIATAKDYLAANFAAAKTFKVETKRGDKKFPMTSTEISQHVGGELADLFPEVRPDMHHPDLVVNVEMREKYAFVHAGPVPGAGGMPIGSNGRAALLLSGGIDSPVAGWMMAKRGLELVGIHFFSYPYTSERAKEKVLELGRKLTAWCGRMSVMVVPFTKIQEEIRDKCHEELFTLVMRRFMMRIAEKVAVEYGCGALITGESLGQVASQTMPAMAVTGAVCELPVFRPCIGMDKEEIIRIARKIDTFETSILPYEDCCTVFTPKHPNTKPKMPKILEAESNLDVETLVDEAVKGVEIAMLSYQTFDRYDTLFTQVPLDVAEAKAKYPLVIVSFHWGAEKDYAPNSNQQKMGKMAIDAGADLVVGHHSHRINPIEEYNGKYIVYSLGNFCFSGNSKPDDMSSFLFQIRWRVTDAEITQEDFRIIPIRISSRTDYNDFTPTVLDKATAIDGLLTTLKENGKKLDNPVSEYPLDW